MEQAFRNDNKKEVNSFLINSKLLIDRNIYKFLFKLLYCIFIKSNRQEKIKNKLQDPIKKINRNLIRTHDNFITCEYSTNNLINIVKFVRQQNNLYASEIIENILIIIFSFAFKTGKENIFGIYLYSNISKLKDRNNEYFVNWFNPNMLNEDLSNLKRLLRHDFSIEEFNYRNKIQDKPIFNFLSEIYLEKNIQINKDKIINNINRRIFDMKRKINYIFDNEENNDDEIDDDIYEQKNIPIPILRSLFISVYIYYQNKNSPLMQYTKEKNELQKMPFVYNLSEAEIENNNIRFVLSPVRIEPRIEEINISKNDLKENCFLELAKIFLFNSKSIKLINFHASMIK